VPANNSIQTKTERGMACRFESLEPLDWLESDRHMQQGSSPAAQLNAWAGRHSDASRPTGDSKFAVRLLVAHGDDEARRLLVFQRSRLFRAIGLPWVLANPCSVQGDSGYCDNKKNRIEASRPRLRESCYSRLQETRVFRQWSSLIHSLDCAPTT
jgi:hypothetical protein